MYIYQRPGWPQFTWDDSKITPLLTNARHNQGRMLGKMEALGFGLREEASLQTLAQDVVKTSESKERYLMQTRYGRPSHVDWVWRSSE